MTASVLKANVWLNHPGDEQYWLDGSYEEIPLQGAEYGARVSYRYGDHSAILFEPDGLDGIVVSKWGQGPLVAHWFGYAPYDSSALEFFVRALGEDRW